MTRAPKHDNQHQRSRRTMLTASGIVSIMLAAYTSTACSGNAGHATEPRDLCERAYEQGLGNAATSERSAWIADCVSETTP